MDAGSAPRRVPAPNWLAEHAQRFQTAGTTPTMPRLAATVLLLRDHPDGVEVYTQRRAPTMPFAPGMYAFPGGSVSPEDEPGPEPDARLVMQMGLSPVVAGSVLRAAVREVAEETGVRLSTDVLAPWARWLTPEFEPRRYDTYFLLAPLPAGQLPADAAGEADHALWLPVTDYDRLPMLPPTRHTLTELSRYPDVAAMLAAAADRDVSEPIRPVLEVDADGTWLRLP